MTRRVFLSVMVVVLYGCNNTAPPSISEQDRQPHTWKDGATYEWQGDGRDFSQYKARVTEYGFRFTGAVRACYPSYEAEWAWYIALTNLGEHDFSERPEFILFDETGKFELTREDSHTGETQSCMPGQNAIFSGTEWAPIEAVKSAASCTWELNYKQVRR